MMGNYWYGGMGWIGMILGAILCIAVLIGLIYLIAWAVRRTSGNSSQSGSQAPISQSAKDIVKARYAKGEITRDEYQKILSDLDR